MRRTLYLKLILAYIIFGIFGFIMVSTFASSMTLEHLIREQAEKMYEEATLIANTYATDLYNNQTSLDAVQKQLDALDTYMNATIWIMNPSGRLILDSSTILDINEEKIVENFDPTITLGSYYTTGDFFGYFKEDMLSVYAPITTDFSIKGYVVIHSSMKDLKASKESLLSISYLLLILLFLLSLIILLFFTEFVYVPIKRITEATEHYATGDMNYDLSIDSDDELGYLGGALSYMAHKVATAEEDQKKFIANVSHDFRSPLTSIKGYLEAMIDGTIPEQMHEKYLKVVLNETERLTKLTNGLLTLNNLNMTGMVLEKSIFDINQVIKSVVESFEGTLFKKKISVDLVLTGERLPVEADMSKIQQVLYNLMDNAIKFSYDDSTIKIETTQKHNKVFVSVKDSGIGIPKESLKLIWDRFYKTDLSRGKDKKGTGLGLAITKEIIRAHKENINVISTEGVGTEFIFSLPVYDDDDDDDLA